MKSFHTRYSEFLLGLCELPLASYQVPTPDLLHPHPCSSIVCAVNLTTWGDCHNSGRRGFRGLDRLGYLARSIAPVPSPPIRTWKKKTYRLGFSRLLTSWYGLKYRYERSRIVIIQTETRVPHLEKLAKEKLKSAHFMDFDLTIWLESSFKSPEIHISCYYLYVHVYYYSH